MIWACTCGWSGKEDKLLTAPSPFNPEDELVACPNCQITDELYNQCDEPGCKWEATCGFPTDKGYRRTCGKHYVHS